MDAVNERNLKPSTLLDKIYDNIAGQKVFFKEKSCQVLMNERGFSQADQKKTNDGVFWACFFHQKFRANDFKLQISSREKTEERTQVFHIFFLMVSKAEFFQENVKDGT